jgi:hypothetical protein
MLWVVTLLVGALALRLSLAGLGWPASDSDEGTMGLMADDILWHGAHPIFLYGQNYMGAGQAYFASSLFALLGPTNLALHVTTALETLLFFLMLYALTRTVYSPRAALWSLALLALGPADALFNDLRAGAGAQDTLLFGVTVFALVYLRLRERRLSWRSVALDLGIGLAAGLGLWGHLLIIPFLLAAAVALTGRLLSEAWSAARRDGLGRAALVTLGAAASQWLPIALGVGVGAAPFLAANLASHGATFRQVFLVASDQGSAAHPGLLGRLLTLAQQLAATLLVGLPHVLGSGVVCPQCAYWPRPHLTITARQLALEAAVSLPYSGVVIGLWALAAFALLPDAWRARLLKAMRLNRLASRGQHGYGAEAGMGTGAGVPVAVGNAVWWGRVLFTLGAALVLLEYVASRASYVSPYTSARYLVAIYAFTPVLVAPLLDRLPPLARLFGRPLDVTRSVNGAAAPTSAAARSVRVLAPGALALLLVLMLALNAYGAATTLAHAASDRTDYGVPAGNRDAQLIAYLEAHDLTRIYSGYWECDRLMFEAAERIACAATNDVTPFAHGFNRVAAMWSLLAATAHPAYVLDPTDPHIAPSWETTLTQAIASNQPPLAGYVRVTVAGFRVYYDARSG